MGARKEEKGISSGSLTTLRPTTTHSFVFRSGSFVSEGNRKDYCQRRGEVVTHTELRMCLTSVKGSIHGDREIKLHLEVLQFITKN